jgi:hypothetical protein
MKSFKKFHDDRFALTTLQNPLCVASQKELAQAVEQERQRYQQPAAIPAAPSPATPNPSPNPDPAAAPAAANPSPAPDPQAAAPASPDSENETARQSEQQEESYEYAMIVPVESPLADENAQLPPRKPRKTRKKRAKSKALGASAARLLKILERAKKLGLIADPPTTNQPAQPVAVQAAEAPVEEDPPEFDEFFPETLTDAQLAQLSAIERHSRRCSVCNHPFREEIDEYFLSWRSPKSIMDSYGIKADSSIYHHAHVFGLFELRNRNLRAALGNIIQEADQIQPTTKDVIHAVRALAHVSPQGEWVQPVNRSEVQFSGRRSPVFANREDVLIAGDKN